MGAWGLRPHTASLVVGDRPRSHSSSLLVCATQAPCARPGRIPGQAPRRPLAAVLAGPALVTVMCLAQSGAAGPRVDRVTPAHVPAAARIRVRIAGDGFEPGLRATLLGGGPFLESTYEVPEGARGVEVSAGHACVPFYSHT